MRFAFVLTHDVEGSKGLSRCHELAEMEMRLGFRSSFNFVPEGEYETPRSLRTFLTECGFEIGVHDLRHDGKLYASRKGFSRQAQTINRYLADWGAVGFRSGFMLHNFDWLRDLNVLYDASSFDTDPLEPQPDSANTIFPFWVGRSDGSGYVELPYTLPQDSTLFLLLQETGIDTWTRKLDWVALHGGMALLNVHPDFISFNGTRRSSEYESRIYQDFLEYVASRYGREAWCALPRDVAAYIRDIRSRSTRQLGNAQFRASSATVQADAPNSLTRADLGTPHVLARQDVGDSSDWRLQGKRVAMVMFSYYPADPRPRRAAEALVSKGMRVDLICLTESANDPKHEVLDGVDVLRIPLRRRRGSSFTYGLQYSAFLTISAGILAIRSVTRGYDLVYVHNMPDVLTVAALVPKAFGARVILDLHDPMPELMSTIFGPRPDALAIRLLKHVERWSIGIADSVVTVNRACARLFTSRSCPTQKMNVIMNSPDERIFRLCAARSGNMGIEPQSKPFVIIYHGSLVERNGLDLAVDALARIRPSIPRAELRIYGTSSPFLDRVMEKVKSRGLQNAVRYLGPKSTEELVPAIEECDLGIIPNRRSVFTELNTPTRIFEYLALGKPVIAPRAPGICDYFDDRSLVFFELGNAKDLAQKIQYVFCHPLEVAEIVERGQRIYQQHCWSMERSRLIRIVAALLCTQNTGFGHISAAAEPLEDPV
jgi:glycosyltransferase involved in cell wall biosynthesis